MLVSIIVPCRNEAAFIGPCLDSILATTYPRSALEILVVDGRSDDGTRAVLEWRAAVCPQLRMVDNPRRTVPAALNVGIRAARGEVILRMDAHVIYPPAYIPTLVGALLQSGADNVGGCVVARPGAPTPMARGIAYAQNHPLGVGNARFRLGVREPCWVDTVPFGCYRRSVFDRIGFFDEDLVRNQDDEFNHRLIGRGGRILLLPDVTASYFTRPTLGQLARMYYQYGLFKPLAARKIGRVRTVRQLIPAAFLLGMTGLALLALHWSGAGIVWATIAGLYAASIAGAALSAVPRQGLRAALAAAAAFPVMHGAYGIGFLRGLGRALGRRARWKDLDPDAVPLSR